MKKIYKIFMAVAAVAGVTACTTDVTEDLGVNINEGQTTLTLSLDDTRTQLGEKADGAYPLTWAAGDAISVNGSVSNALAEGEANGTTATFNFEKGFGSAPYFIAYPATSTNNQVVFAAEQTHTSNTTFGNGAAVMYGYANDLSSVQLNHLTGVLKIGIVSGTEELTFIKEVRISTVDRKPIAGAFTATYNAETEKMELTPAEGATEVITYKAESDAGFPVPAGTSTSENPAYIHIAVPAGVYGELYVTLESADGVMYKVVKTDSTKPLNAGKVREFSDNIEFVPTDEAEVFVISNYGDLYEYKEAVEGGSTLGAVLVNDIEIPATNDVQLPAWEPINVPAYAATFNGNGYAIKGLAKPLFDSVAATIKGVHLKDVKIAKEYTSANTGALVNTYFGESVTHCSAEGTINLTRGTSLGNRIGGLVGHVSNFTTNWEVSDCVNNCAITLALTMDETSQLTFVGGVVAGSTNDETNMTTITCTNNINNGVINVTGDSAATVIVGGIMGRYVNYLSNFTNCHNTAKLSATLGSSTLVHMAGIFAHYSMGSSSPIGYDTAATNCSNSGDISLKLTGNTDATATSYSCVGGCFGMWQHVHQANITVTNCDNSGDISVTSEGTIKSQYHLGGIAGCLYGRVTVENCENTGESVKFVGNTVNHITCVGGLVGRGAVRAADQHGASYVATNVFTMKNCRNESDIFFDINTKNNCMAHIGGAIGLTYGYSSTYSTFTFDNIVNTGNITVESEDWPLDNTIHDGNGEIYIEATLVGGIIGSNWIDNSSPSDPYLCPFKITNCKNGEKKDEGLIQITGTKSYSSAVGGIIGLNTYCNEGCFAIDKCTNNMQLKHDSATISANKISFGGICGRISHQDDSQETVISNSVNNGAITVGAVSANEVRVGGIIGSQKSHRTGNNTKKMKVILTSVTNNAPISVSNFSCGKLWVGGVIANGHRVNATSEAEAYTFTDVANKGNVSVLNVTPTADCCIGGGIGKVDRDLANITVDCTVTVSEGLNAGMLVGDPSTTTYKFTDCKIGGTLVKGTTSTKLDATNYLSCIFNDGVALSEYAGVTLVE